MIKTKYMFSKAKAKDTTSKAKAKDMTSCPRGASRPWPRGLHLCCSCCHSYADNTRLYTHCLTVDGPASATQFVCCVDDISQRMTLNRLKLYVKI